MVEPNRDFSMFQADQGAKSGTWPHSLTPCQHPTDGCRRKGQRGPGAWDEGFRRWTLDHPHCEMLCHDGTASPRVERGPVFADAQSAEACLKSCGGAFRGFFTKDSGDVDVCPAISPSPHHARKGEAVVPCRYRMGPHRGQCGLRKTAHAMENVGTEPACEG